MTNANKTGYTVLLIEDDLALSEGIADMLEVKGFSVLKESSGMSGLRTALRAMYDLVLLDVNLPELSGWDILKAVNAERPGMPVIMLTAKGSEDDRVRGLSEGADDYVVKPFGIRELVARIEAVLRRSPERPLPVTRRDLSEGGYLDAETRRVCKEDGEMIELTGREYDLLDYLMAHGDRVVSKSELLLRVWKVDPKMVETKSVEMTLARLREKLGNEWGKYLRTYRGRGYRWLISDEIES